jgi:hypothetical protein
VGEFIGAAEQELASSRRRRRPICRLADSVVVPSQQDPPTAGEEGRVSEQQSPFPQLPPDWCEDETFFVPGMAQQNCLRQLSPQETMRNSLGRPEACETTPTRCRTSSSQPSRSSANPAAATAATTSPASSRNTATPSSRAAAYPRQLPEGEVVQHPRQMPSALWQRHPCEHARDLERIICVDLAPNPAPTASATWIFRLAPPGFSYRRRRRGQGTGSNPAEPAPVASKLARPQRFFNHLRMLTATSRSP